MRVMIHKKYRKLSHQYFFFLVLFQTLRPNLAQNNQSVARQWIETLLRGIRGDYARPTIHARNLFHVSSAIFDAWAVESDVAETYLLGKRIGEFECAFDRNSIREENDTTDVDAVREEVMSYAAYRLILHRFKDSPDSNMTIALADGLMQDLGYNINKKSTQYKKRGAFALGNHIAKCYINFGLQDGSNEQNEYGNKHYMPVNPPLNPTFSGNPDILDMDRWQPLGLSNFIDQGGNPITDMVPFLSPEWGQVQPFSLKEKDQMVNHRDGFNYKVYFDPGAPPSFQGKLADEYKWGFLLVAIWASHLDESDGVNVDISPRSLGNVTEYPDDLKDYHKFYDLINGADGSQGYTVNPSTGKPYKKQIVPRGDYTRVLAEFWADGPESETPPGHWFVILNEVSDHPEFKRRFKGVGPELSLLEWDVKAYFILGGAMHDAAIAAWGIKGYYDYIRPVSAIRAMAQLGQSSDPQIVNYHPDGIPLAPGYVELIKENDPLDNGGKNRHEIKIFSWNGPGTSKVGWMLAKDWWPYQRPTFVTPPFAGYVSGHSTFSRAAADVLTKLTGSEYFPGGMSEFTVRKNDFLVFEKGPSVKMTLQWAKYKDAADQCSLSRIWGGIHPPADDIPGRKIGVKIGQMAFELAETYFIETAQSPFCSDDEQFWYNNKKRTKYGCKKFANSPERCNQWDSLGRLVKNHCAKSCMNCGENRCIDDSLYKVKIRRVNKEKERKKKRYKCQDLPNDIIGCDYVFENKMVGEFCRASCNLCG